MALKGGKADPAVISIPLPKPKCDGSTPATVPSTTMGSSDKEKPRPQSKSNAHAGKGSARGADAEKVFERWGTVDCGR